MIDVTQGSSPLVLGLPHTGTEIPPHIWLELNDTGRELADTDWHVHTLYDGLAQDVTKVRTRLHRYVIDVNRDPEGGSLYPGQKTTGLCPLTDFDGQAIYREGAAPDANEVERRREEFHQPYHRALADELNRVRAKHGFAVLYDCHSIRSNIPFLFEGRLPDFNIGTNDGKSCDPEIERLVCQVCGDAAGFTNVLNGRFKGGWTTRHYGRPSDGLHAVQMELAQSTYMAEAPPWLFLPDKADHIRPHLTTILAALKNWSPA